MSHVFILVRVHHLTELMSGLNLILTVELKVLQTSLCNKNTDGRLAVEVMRRYPSAEPVSACAFKGRLHMLLRAAHHFSLTPALKTLSLAGSPGHVDTVMK